MKLFHLILRWLIRHRLIEFLVSINAYFLVSKIAIYSIKKIDNNYSNVALVGHNPAYTEISNYFSEKK